MLLGTPARQGRILVACAHLFLALLLSSPAMAGARFSPSHPEGNVYFELEGGKEAGVLDPGEPVELSVSLTGASAEKDSIVAVFEGKPFVRRLVPMWLLSDQDTLRSSVTLEPYLIGFASPEEKAFRVTVTFARVEGMRLHRFLTRTVYMTMGIPKGTWKIHTAGLNQGRHEPDPDPFPQFMPHSEAARLEIHDGIQEQNLIPSPPTGQQQSYWRRISYLINRSWRHPDIAVGRGKKKGTVQVRFRLYANGEAQLIQVEQSSGFLDVDEAGLKAILNAHPFPPFPSPIYHKSIDLHVELNETARAVPQAVGVRVYPDVSTLSHP